MTANEVPAFADAGRIAVRLDDGVANNGSKNETG
jgi:hypothetical protein